jgi:hypothetical protein
MNGLAIHYEIGLFQTTHRPFRARDSTPEITVMTTCTNFFCASRAGPGSGGNPGHHGEFNMTHWSAAVVAVRLRSSANNRSANFPAPVSLRRNTSSRIEAGTSAIVG